MTNISAACLFRDRICIKLKSEIVSNVSLHCIDFPYFYDIQLWTLDNMTLLTVKSITC